MIFERTEQLDREVGARVRARRRELRMSQSKLGDQLGVTFQQVQKYERGVNRISASSLVLIAEALQCRPTDLLGVDEGRPKIDWSKFHDNEANAALEAFAAIDNPRIRRSVLELIRTLSDTSDRPKRK
jgi:transcriptional regulator with XRE-family HTH domain